MKRPTAAFVFALTLACLGIAATFEAQEQAAAPAPAAARDPFLDSLTGVWTGPYHVGPYQLTVRAEVEWALNGAYLRAENTCELPGGGKFVQNEYWRKSGEKTYDLWFFDSLGNAGRCHVDRTAEGYTLTGPECAKEPLGKFRNLSVIKNPDEIEYSIEAGPQADGTFVPVAKGVYRREKQN